VTDETILHAFNNPVLVADLDEGMAIFVGPDRAGNLYESESSDQRRVRL